MLPRRRLAGVLVAATGWLATAPLLGAAAVEPPRNSGGAWIFFRGQDPAADLGALATRMELLEQIGSQYVRLWVPWSEVEPRPDRFDFDKFDRLIATIVASGQRVQITLCSVMSPRWFWRKMRDGRRYTHLHWRCPRPACNETTLAGAGDEGRHRWDPRGVQSPHLSLWAPPELKDHVRDFVGQSFARLLDKWAPFVVSVHLSLGRLNEPTYPSADHFWAYDPNAQADFVAAMAHRYGADVTALNLAWDTSHSGFDEIAPPEAPFEGLSERHRRDFLEWYRDSKRAWVEEAMGWVEAELEPWQRAVIFAAGASGDVRMVRRGRTVLERAAAEPWEELPRWVRQTARHVQDNRWILERAAASDGLWVVQYAGVGGVATCRRNRVCRNLRRWANREGYRGPLYGQIPNLTGDADQPRQTAAEVIRHGFSGLHWNKDEHLFRPGPGEEPLSATQPNELYESLLDGWADIQGAYTGDYDGPLLANVAASASGTSALVTWATGEPADAVVLWSTDPELLDRVSVYRDREPRTRTHAVPLFGLAPSTRHYYRVFSTDAAGNSSIGELGSFVTGAAQPPGR